MARFTSKHTNKVDKKGRVSVPASFRTILAERGPKLFYLKPNFRLGALDALTDEHMTELQARIDEFDMESDERDALLVSTFAECEEIAFDDEGRMILPRHLMEFAGIGESAVFAGLGEYFQIWEPSAFEAHRQRVPEKVRTLTLPKVGRRGAVA